MNINDLEIITTIDKEQILVYIKEGILIPKKDTNNEEIFTWEDSLLLIFCIELESINITIENIKHILNGARTIKECLHPNIEYTETQLKYANYMLECIHNNDVRKKLYFGYQKINYSRLKDYSLQEQLVFEDNKMYLTNINGDINKTIGINYKHIKKAVFMVVNRAPCRIDFKNKKFGLPYLVYGNGGVSPYYIDLDIIEHNITHKFESTTQDNIVEIFELLKSKDILIEDPLQLYDLFKTTPSAVGRMKFFERHYKIWANEYNLENPRKETLENQLLLQKKVHTKKQ